MADFIVDNILFFFFLLMAAAIGWYFGTRRNSKNNIVYSGPEKDYFIGLNYLLNDEPDEAIDIFIRALEINSDTLETHLALGTLLRRRGKVDKAIQVYQDLLAETDLISEDYSKIKLELIQSYIAAGLLDRAEALIKELSTANTNIRIDALKHSVAIYQLEKEWLEAINAIDELISICPVDVKQSYQTIAAHFYCELALQEMDYKHLVQAREFLKKAQSYDRENVRVALLLGNLEFMENNHKVAAKELQRVIAFEPLFAADVFDLLVQSLQELGKNKALTHFIQSQVEALQQGPSTHDSRLVLKLSEYFLLKGEKEKALSLLHDFLVACPALPVIAQSLNIESSASNSEENKLFSDDMHTYKDAIARILESNSFFQCRNCGFELKSMHWLCPGCSRWGEVKPIEEKSIE